MGGEKIHKSPAHYGLCQNRVRHYGPMLEYALSTEKNLFNCFGNCKAGGNVIDLVAMVEFGDLEKQSIRKVALLLKNWFLPGSNNDPGGNQLVSEERKDGGSKDTELKVNKPLKFNLKYLDPEHDFFRARGILPETVKHFG